MISRVLRRAARPVSRDAGFGIRTGLTRINIRPQTLSPTASSIPTAIFNQTRGFKFSRIEVSNPLGVQLLRVSRSVGFGLIFFYVIGSAGFLFLYFQETSKSDGVQKIPDDWSFKVKSLVREGVNSQMDNKLEHSLQCFRLAVEEMTTTEAKDGTRVPVEDLGSKSPQWLGGYSDVLIRYALLEELFENSEKAKVALLASEEIRWGTLELKSTAAIQLGKYALLDKEVSKAEEYFVNAVKAVATPRMMAYFAEGPNQDLNKAVLISDPSLESSSKLVNQNDGMPTGEGITSQLYNASIELGKFYAVTGRYTRALEILLSALRSIRRKREPEGRSRDRIPDPDCFEARTMSYISEILWAADKKKREEAVTWAEGSYFEALPLSNTTVECGLCATMALENLAKMYSSLGLPEEVANCKRRLSEVHAPVTNASQEWSIADLFSRKEHR